MCRKGSKVTAPKRQFMRNCGYKNHKYLPKQIRLRNPQQIIIKIDLRNPE